MFRLENSFLGSKDFSSLFRKWRRVVWNLFTDILVESAAFIFKGSLQRF
jgi:hypothetical protein